MHRLPAVALAAAAFTTAALAAGCGDDGGSPATPAAAGGEPVVELVDLEFQPDELTVEAGTEVTWRWTDKAMHNVTGDSFDSGNMAEGTFTHTFDDPGTHEYRCTLHPGMDGTITVE